MRVTRLVLDNRPVQMFTCCVRPVAPSPVDLIAGRHGNTRLTPTKHRSFCQLSFVSYLVSYLVFYLVSYLVSYLVFFLSHAAAVSQLLNIETSNDYSNVSKGMG